MDQLRRSLVPQLLLDDSWPHGVEPAVDIALLGRYYERIADHAVSWPAGSSTSSPASGTAVDRLRTPARSP